MKDVAGEEGQRISEHGEVVHVVRDVRDDACGGGKGGVRGGVRGGALATPPWTSQGASPPPPSHGCAPPPASHRCVSTPTDSALAVPSLPHRQRSTIVVRAATLVCQSAAAAQSAPVSLPKCLYRPALKFRRGLKSARTKTFRPSRIQYYSAS